MWNLRGQSFLTFTQSCKLLKPSSSRYFTYFLKFYTICGLAVTFFDFPITLITLSLYHLVASIYDNNQPRILIVFGSYKTPHLLTILTFNSSKVNNTLDWLYVSPQFKLWQTCIFSWFHFYECITSSSSRFIQHHFCYSSLLLFHGVLNALNEYLLKAKWWWPSHKTLTLSPSFSFSLVSINPPERIIFIFGGNMHFFLQEKRYKLLIQLFGRCCQVPSKKCWQSR